jgi:hypothetical protein
VAFRVLAAGNKPDYRKISYFRKVHHMALKILFEPVFEMALNSRAMKLGGVALEESKIGSNESKPKTICYTLMNEKESQLL